MKLNFSSLRSTLILVILLAAPASASADVIADWNAIAVQATITGSRPNPTGVIDIAMVHAAIFDAVQAIEKQYEPYYVEINDATGSPVAAAAKAARDILVNRFPAQAGALDTAYQQYLSSHGLFESDPGVEVGARAAAGIIALRACDGSFPNPAPPPFFGATSIGVWRSTQPMVAPWLGNVAPFTLTKPSQFRAARPPALTSRQYARDYNEVKALGALNNSSRTPEQTDVAQFYAGNTLVIWNRVLRDVANEHVDNIADSSRMFAVATLSIADALITCWNDKNRYSFWRPSTAIQEGDSDGNPRTAADPGWAPLITNPAYPDYTSGANAFASATTRALERFFGTDAFKFSVTTTNTGPTIEDTRRYRRFSQAAQDVEDARVYLGIHFRFADVAARKQGRQVADWVFEHFMRPLDNDDDEDGGR
jgi:hypothetical protein